MTTLRDAIAEWLHQQYGDCFEHEHADEFIAVLKAAPEPGRLELAGELNPFRPMELEVVALLCPPEWRCDECDNGIEAHWNWCAWCGCNLTLPAPPSEEK